MTTYRTNHTVVMFRKNSLDAFYAAFLYWFFFGKDSIRPSDTIHHDRATISFKAVDVFEAQAYSAERQQNTHEKLARFPFIGNGDSVVSIGLNLTIVPAASQFFSYENDETFVPEISIDGCVYNYDRTKKLTHLMLESLEAVGHIKETDKSFILLNQFFRFFDGKKSGLQLDDAVANRVLTNFPRLSVDNFVDLGKFIEDPHAFMEERKKRSPEDAVREYVLSQADKAAQNRMVISGFYPGDPDLKVNVINSDLIDYPGADQLFGGHMPQVQATLIYNQTQGGIRARYQSSLNGENALTLFPLDRPKVGDRAKAEWLITNEDLFSILMLGRQAA